MPKGDDPGLGEFVVTALNMDAVITYDGKVPDGTAGELPKFKGNEGVDCRLTKECGDFEVGCCGGLISESMTCPAVVERDRELEDEGDILGLAALYKAQYADTEALRRRFEKAETKLSAAILATMCECPAVRPARLGMVVKCVRVKGHSPPHIWGSRNGMRFAGWENEEDGG